MVITFNEITGRPQGAALLIVLSVGSEEGANPNPGVGAHHCLFCHYFVAAGGNSGNLADPLTTNRPLLPYKHNGGGGESGPPEL